MAQITITNRRTDERITLTRLNDFEAQFLADLTMGADVDWRYESPDTLPERSPERTS